MILALRGIYLYGFILSLDVMRRIGARSQIGQESSNECRSHTFDAYFVFFCFICSMKDVFSLTKRLLQDTSFTPKMRRPKSKLHTSLLSSTERFHLLTFKNSSKMEQELEFTPNLFPVIVGGLICKRRLTRKTTATEK